MANPIRRLVQLVLDKAAAARMGRDAKEAVGGVEGALGRLKGMARAVGTALAAAFAVGKILDFGRAAIAEANRGEQEWSKLANTLRAVGLEADGMRASIEASAAAFQSATVYGAGDYMTALDRMIAITGDAEASTNNMGLVANVAAQYFNGELAPATDLVAKAMNGNVVALQKMGISAEDAQGALEILAERSMGAAEARAQTMAGRWQILTELYNDFLDVVGRTILDSEGAGESMNFLTAAVQYMARWVRENSEEIKAWVTTGIRFAIEATDVLLRTTLALADLFQGGLKTSIGVVTIGLSYIARGYAAAYEAAARFLNLVGAKNTAADLRGTAEVMREGADALREWGEAAITAGSGNVARGLNQFTRRLFSSDQFRSASAARGDLDVNAPQMGRNRRGEDGEEEQLKGIETLNRKLIQLNKHRTTEFEKLTKRRLKLTGMETEALKTQAAAASALVEGIAAAWAGGLGPFARMKARQNLIEGGELAVRATLAALTGFGAKQAAVLAAGAKQHFAIAAAWGALGGVAGGSVATGGGLGLAQGATNSASRNAQPIGGDVTIVLRGPGFSAMNPEVQRVVRGALQEDTERRGNARVRVVTDSTGSGR